MSAPAAAAGERKIKIQVIRLPQREKHVISDISTSLTIGDFQSLLQGKYNIDPEMQLLYIAGIPPKSISTDDRSLSLATLGIRPGDSIELRTMDAALGEHEMKQGTGTWNLIGTISANSGSFQRKSMPPDNSCLFHAIAWVCANKQSGAAAAHKMRELAANLVASDPQRYNTLLLGSPNQLYQQHILNPNTWGGAIELMLFATNFQTEIIAFDPNALREDVYGGDAGYPKRAFIIYTGDHYDAMVFHPSSGSEQVVFSDKDHNAHARARDLIESLHAELVQQGKATKQGAWRHNKDIKRTNAANGKADAEREKRVAEEKARISTSSAASLTPSGSFSSSSGVAPTVTAAAPAASASNALDTADWECPVCTCINKASARRCSACDSANPNPPAAAPVVPSVAVTPPRSTAPPTSSNNGSTGRGFNCAACTAWNETPSSRCAVCNTRQPGASSAVDDLADSEDAVPTPLPQIESQMIGGGEDYMDDPRALRATMTPAQRTVAGIAWVCTRCTVENRPNTFECSACSAPHPHPLLNPNASYDGGDASAAAVRAGVSDHPAAPTTWRERLRQATAGPPPWICERCGRSQSSQLYMCGNCRLINTGLQVRMQQGQSDQQCNIM